MDIVSLIIAFFKDAVIIIERLQEHLVKVKRLHQQDLEQGYGAAPLPYALERKYPNVERQWIKQLNRQSESERLKSVSAVILSVIALPLICCKTATISAPFKNYSGIKMFGQR